jgi:hypothetical protein
MTEKDDLEDSVIEGRILLNGPTGSEMWGQGLDRAGSG